MDGGMTRSTTQFEAALKVVEKLRAAGYEAYLAGGCVRDLLLGRQPKDFDVATSATPEVVLQMFERTFAVGAHFGVILVAHGEGDGYFSTEVATFRSDGAYTDGRHPNSVRYTKSAEEDVKRRDFTINGLLMDPERLFPQRLKPDSLAGTDVRAEQAAENLDRAQSLHGSVTGHDFSRAEKASRTKWASAPAELQSSDSAERQTFSAANEARTLRAVIDFVGGLSDIEAGVVRAIGRAEERFEEDHLRMLRAVRFAARFGFELEAGTKRAIRSLAAKTAAVSRERVRDELTRMLTEGHARRAFELLDETGLLAEVLPEVARMKGVEQPPQYHPEGDVWVHTLALLGQLEEGCSMALAWGALLHDVGKPPTFRRAPDRIRFDGHVEWALPWRRRSPGGSASPMKRRGKRWRWSRTTCGLRMLSG